MIRVGLGAVCRPVCFLMLGVPVCGYGFGVCTTIRSLNHGAIESLMGVIVPM